MKAMRWRWTTTSANLLLVVLAALSEAMMGARLTAATAREAGGSAGDVEPVVRATMEVGGLNWNRGKAMRQATATLEIEIHPKWAPVAAERFIELCESEFYDGNRFFRVSPGYVAQFGVNDNPKWTNYWLKRRMPDELMLDNPDYSPHEENNVNYTMAFAREDNVNSGSQVFINLRNNSFVFEKENIITFAKIVNEEGQRKLEGLFPAEPGIDMGKYDKVSMDRVLEEGGEYMNKFPKLSSIVSCKIAAEEAETAAEVSVDDEL